ncbi:MAG: SRPBCC family protein [Thermoplasmata archaeon]
MQLSLGKFIDRPPADVFRFTAVNHVQNHPRWDPDMELEQLTEGPIGVGTVIRRRHDHYGDPIEGSMEVVEYEPDQAMSTVIHDGPIEIRSRMLVEPEAKGGTRLTLEIEIPGRTEPLDPTLVERSLSNMKTLIEAEVPRTS